MINTTVKEQTEFSDEEGKFLLDKAEACIRAALEKQPLPEFNNRLAKAPVVGVFVSLKRGNGILRACCGSLTENEPTALGDLLITAAERSALNDVRFPRIDISELPHLELEVSVMHDLKVLPTDPNLRLNEITIGKHGLIISHDRGRGLLLPQVAAENSWDTPTFYEQICKKAALPTDSWLRPEAVLKKFSASIFHRNAEKRDVDFRELPKETREKAFDYAKEVLAKGPSGDVKMPEELRVPVSPSGWGVLIQTTGNGTDAKFSKNNTLGALVQQSANGLHRPGKPEENEIKDFLVFSHPIPLHPQDFPRRFASIPVGIAVTARKGNRASVVIKKGPHDPVQQVLKQMGETPQTWKKSGVQLDLQVVVDWSKAKEDKSIAPPVNLDTPGGIRPAVVAGQFYPAAANEVKDQLDRYFNQYNKNDKVKARAVMLPHAGWKYCGDIIAETLGQVVIPDMVVIIGPKHTPLGAKWAISSAKRWQIPGAEVPLDEESVAFLAASVKEMEKDSLAHQREHGAEVIVPFLHYLNPKVRIAPIAVGAGTHDDFVRLGKSLEAFRKRLAADGEDCLFIISSDLNHFANDKENRRLDKMALDAFKTGRSQKLFDTCVENHISMCGMRPAVAVLNSLGINAEIHSPDIDIVRYETSARVSKDVAKVVGYAGAVIL